MAKNFNLADFVQPPAVSNLNTACEVQLLPTRSIFPNEKNFYNTDDVDELVNSILLHGVLDPLTVRPSGDGVSYVIISGHRRHRAVLKILDDGLAENSEKFERTPCIVVEPESELIEELMLVQANSSTRVLSPMEVARQAETVERLLYDLQAHGYAFPGRMRDHVAKICGVHSSRLGRLKKIQNSLYAPFLERFQAGTISEAAAYKLAQMGAAEQKKLFESTSARAPLTEKTVIQTVRGAQTAASRENPAAAAWADARECVPENDGQPCVGLCFYPEDPDPSAYIVEFRDGRFYFWDARTTSVPVRYWLPVESVPET